MTLAVWPDGLPRNVTVDSFAMELRDGRASSSRDAGPPGMRRRSSAAVKPYSGTIIINNEQRLILDQFWEITLKGGVLPFLYLSCIDGGGLETEDGDPLETDLDELLEAENWWLVQFASPPQISRRAPGKYQAAIAFSILK